MRRLRPILRLLAALDGGPGRHGHDVAPAFGLPPGVEVLPDLAYGASPSQRLDVYRPRGAATGGVIVLVHGGGWRRGDKRDARLLGNKVAHWVGRGWVLASVNYSLRPESDPTAQAADVAAALAFVQARAAQWGADPGRCVLMGHSAGAHLVALLSADAPTTPGQGARPWQATVAIDTEAYDVVSLMEAPHPPLYDLAFGHDPAQWRLASPIHRLCAAPAMPILLVCSARRDAGLAQARAFADRVESLGGRATVLPVDLGHFEINRGLGQAGDYTAAVDAFLAAA